MPYLSLPGVDLWYEDTGGSGTPVILLHAASGTTDCWVHQLPTFTIAGYRCISYDRRTWGCSRPTESGPQPGFAGDDLHALVEALGLDRFHLVGTAAGAIPALDYALSHPERVRSLVAANTIGGVQDPEYLEVQHRLRPQQIQDLPVELRELGPSYRGTDPDGAARWLEIDHASRPYGPVPTQPLREPITYREVGNHAGPRHGAVRRGGPSVPAGPDANAGRTHTCGTVRVLARCRSCRFLGAAPRLERPSPGVHRPALTVRQSTNLHK